MFDFSGQVVIVTGAAGNLGRAVVEAFLKAQAHVVAVDRAPDRLLRLFPDIAGSSEHWLATGVDVLDTGTVAATVAQVVARWRRIDVLVNTVGGFQGGQPLQATPISAFDHLIDLNVRSTYLVSQAIIPQMVAQKGGKIINISSRSGLSGPAGSGAYSAAKASVLRLTEAMAGELKGAGVNVNCVLPGTIDTPENREAMPNADSSRWVAPTAIADVILFLASDAARAIYGAAIPVYGLS